VSSNKGKEGEVLLSILLVKVQRKTFAQRKGKVRGIDFIQTRGERTVPRR